MCVSFLKHVMDFKGSANLFKKKVCRPFAFSVLPFFRMKREA